MGLYEDLKMIDIITPILGKAKISFTEEGEPKVYLVWEGEAQSPWISYVKTDDRACPLWHSIYFDYYGVIPRGCRSCWKVVMSVPNVRQAMRIEQWQRENDKYDCKCGIEARMVTGKLGKFGAYWYAPIEEGLDGGRKMFSWLQQQFPGVKLILKRGCTEFEAKYFPSDKWDEFAAKLRWDFYEQMLNDLFVMEITKFGLTPKLFHPVIKARWIEWAFEHGDETYLDFVDAPFRREYMTYHSSIHNAKDYIGSKYEPIKVYGRRDYGAIANGRAKEEGNNNRPSQLEEGQSEQAFERSEEQATRLTLL